MSPLFKKTAKLEEIFERVKNGPDDENKVIVLGSILSQCRGKDRQTGVKIIDEVLRISKAPVQDLRSLLHSVRDDDLGARIVDKIAGYGMEKNEVHMTLFTIGEGIAQNKGARNRAREHYDRFYDQVTGGNPLARRDLLIPPWS